MGFKTIILIGWLAIELAGVSIALPTTAKIIRNTMPEPSARAASVDLPARAGVSRILVAADGPFVVISSGSTSNMNIHVEVTGDVNGNPHGANAQNPGAGDTCTKPNSVSANIIYKSDRETAKNIGSVIDQAVIMEITYDPSQHPEFEIITRDTDAAALTAFALPCHA